MLRFLPWLLLYGIALSLALWRAGFRGATATAPTAAGSPRGAGARPSRILIVGATGGTGRQLVEQALERGYRVTAFVRDPTRLDRAHPHLRVLTGDVRDEAALAAAVRGQEAVLSALGHRNYYAPGWILSAGTRNLLRAMKEAGTRRLIALTSLGLGDSAGRLGLLYTGFVLPLVLPLYFWDKARQERIIAGSGVAWTIVRPATLTNAPRGGRVRAGAGVGGFLLTASVARADVAAFMLDQLESDRWTGGAPGLCRG